MGIISLITAVAGFVTTIVHYMNHSVALGVVTAVLLVVSMVTGIMDIKAQNKNGGIDYNKVQPGVLGHGISGIVLLLGGIMCIIANVR
jgi:hypothetical protein